MAGITAAGMVAVQFGGLINEDVMQQIWNISQIPLPLQDIIGSGSHHHPYAEWTTDELAAPDTNNAVIDGADVAGDNTKMGQRVGNHTQQSVKRVKVSERAQGSDAIGQSNALAYQVMQRQQELRRDLDAIMASQQASIADDGAAVAGKSAGLGAWLVTNTTMGATGANGGFNLATGIVAAPTPGTKRAISETEVRNVCQSIYQAGGNPSIMLARPAIIRKFSEYLFSATAKVATLMADVGQTRESSVAKGSVNVFVTDFGVTLALTPNRLQPTTAAATSTAFVITPDKLQASYLNPIRVQPLAKTGTADSRLMSCDWTFKVLSEKAHGALRDLDEGAAGIALVEAGSLVGPGLVEEQASEEHAPAAGEEHATRRRR